MLALIASFPFVFFCSISFLDEIGLLEDPEIEARSLTWLETCSVSKIGLYLSFRNFTLKKIGEENKFFGLKTIDLSYSSSVSWIRSSGTI